MRLFVSKKYKAKHQLLARCYNSKDNNSFPTIDELKILLKTDEKIILMIGHELQSNGHVHVQTYTNPPRILCAPEGANAYFQEYYLNQGWENFKTDAFKLVPIILSLLSLLLSIANYISNNKQQVKLDSLEKQTEQVQNKVRP
ncbi:hypothetical protein [Emticicia sp. 17c]|uniref:hypothetical protein n=1 Tax=Emticicia sp. 17c TaxID=3127704 RepID=UPI00301C7FFF